MPFDQNSNAVNAILAMFDTETVVIKRRGSGATPTITTIFSGNGDLQSTGGGSYMTPGGVVDMADAKLTLPANADGSLPDVQVGDSVNDSYTIVNVGSFLTPISHIEAQLKRGGLTRQGRAR